MLWIFFKHNRECFQCVLMVSEDRLYRGFSCEDVSEDERGLVCFLAEGLAVSVGLEAFLKLIRVVETGGLSGELGTSFSFCVSTLIV